MKSRNAKDGCTFIIKILNKQNSTWQGTITWAEEQKTQNFRSALEMIKLLDEALEIDVDIDNA